MCDVCLAVPTLLAAKSRRHGSRVPFRSGKRVPVCPGRPVRSWSQPSPGPRRWRCLSRCRPNGGPARVGTAPPLPSLRARATAHAPPSERIAGHMHRVSCSPRMGIYRGTTRHTRHAPSRDAASVVGGRGRCRKARDGRGGRLPRRCRVCRVSTTCVALRASHRAQQFEDVPHRCIGRVRETGSIPAKTPHARNLELLRNLHRGPSRVMPTCGPRLPGDCTRMIAVVGTSLHGETRQTRHWPRFA